MKLSRFAIFSASLATLAAVLIGCGDHPRDLVSAPTSASGRVAAPLSTQNIVTVCGHVLVHCGEVKPTPLPGVKLTLTWENGPTLNATTNSSGEYCFDGFDAPSPGLTITVCVDPSTLPPDAILTNTKYQDLPPYCQTLLVVYPNSVTDVDFGFAACGPPPPPPCSIQGSIDSNFNGTAVVGASSGPAYIWFNSNLSLKNMPEGSHVSLTNASVIINGVPHAVPDATITFASVACASTSYDEGTNTWNTTVPLAGSDEIFVSGLAFPVTNLPGGARVTWQGRFSSDAPGRCLSWKWGAAAYKTWPIGEVGPDYNAANIKPTHNNSCNVTNGDHAGTPENAALKKSVTGGARGGGGSNFTGSWSGTQTLCPPCKE